MSDVYYYVSPLYTETCWITSVLSAQSVCLCFPFIFVQCFPLCKQWNTRFWPNAGLMLADRLRRWVNISPVLGYDIVFGATLNVGQCHRRRANINTPLVRSIVHKVLSRAEWILANTGDAVPTFNRHWVGVGSPPAVCTVRPAAQKTGSAEPVLVWC